MKQIKFKQLATLGLCCSLLMNSLGGVTAFAETVTIESSPTSESTKESTQKSEVSKQEETTKETTGATEKPVSSDAESQEQSTTQESVKNEEPKKIEEKPQQVPDLLQKRAIGVKAGNIVVYEDAVEFPEETYQFGFVNQDGQLVKSDDITITYDYSRYLVNNGTVTWNGIALNQKATTVEKLKKITMPKSILPKNTANGEAMINISFSLPKYYTGLNIYNKSGKIDSNYPLPSRHYYYDNNEVIGMPSDASFITWLTLAKAADNSYVFKEALTSPEPINSSFPMMRRGVSGYTYYHSLDAPVYYHLTQRKVTENFVDASGTKITPPTGFTQGKQTGIDSDPYTFKQSGTLPETYKASNGKTYKFKGWYKGKTKPATLQTTKTPSYAVTYDDNDDLNVVYEEIEAFNFPALTYQFGFVDESGNRVDASTIGLTYDNWHGEVLGSKDDWKTVSLEKGQIASTKNNLKEIVYPAQSFEILSDGTSQYSAANITFTLPKYYEKISVYNKSGTFDVGYPFPNIQNNNNPEPSVEGSNKNLSSWFELKKSGSQSFIFNQTTESAPIDVQVPAYLREIVYNPNQTSNIAAYYVIDKPVYYYLTNRKVTENFVDATGAKITPPTGFTQGKQTVIDSDSYTFKQSGTLPATYTADGKSYKLKGWYKGKDKPATLSTGTPTYKVTYDDNDDLNVVYEEANFPEETYQFGFVNEAGKLVNPADINITYDYKSIAYRRGTGGADATVSFGTIATNQSATTVGDLKNVTLPATVIARPTESGWNGDAYSNFSIKLPRYYQSLSLYDKTGKINPSYPLPVYTRNYSDIANEVMPEEVVINYLTVTQRTDQSYTPKETYLGVDPSVKFPEFLLRVIYSADALSGRTAHGTFSSPVYYHLTNRKVTENFVDATGAKITPPTGFTQGKQIVIDSDNFTYTSAKALPTSYTAGGKTYLFQGWYKGKTKPNTLTTSTTPTYDTTFDDNDDMTAVYKEASISANLTMRGAVDVIDNGATMEYWEVLLKNTGEAPLTSIKIKPTTEWVAGISAPTNLFILGTGQNAKSPKITNEQWEAGFEIPLDKSLPVGGQLTINLIGTKVTGQPNQVLKAAVEVSGNFNKLTASDTVRIKDLDQETKEPTGEGFISVPTFDFGQVGVASATKQHGLKKAADYYGNGTRNPYVRISKTQPNWSLTAQLSQPKSATDSLPTATRLLLGAAPVSSFSNYNQPTELKNTIGTTNAINLTANNAATSIIANQQFTGSDVYQLDFTFDNIKLEVPANQGTAGQQYQAAVTWNLVTGP